VNSPAILSHCALVLRTTQGNETLLQIVLEILKNVIYGESPAESDNFWSMGELMRDQKSSRSSPPRW
jgi:hypothetical protein